MEGAPDETELYRTIANGCFLLSPREMWLR
jgi:hypothetical protein